MVVAEEGSFPASQALAALLRSVGGRLLLGGFCIREVQNHMLFVLSGLDLRHIWAPVRIT